MREPPGARQPAGTGNTERKVESLEAKSKEKQVKIKEIAKNMTKPYRVFITNKSPRHDLGTGWWPQKKPGMAF